MIKHFDLLLSFIRISTKIILNNRSLYLMILIKAVEIYIIFYIIMIIQSSKVPRDNLLIIVLKTLALSINHHIYTLMNKSTFSIGLHRYIQL